MPGLTVRLTLIKGPHEGSSFTVSAGEMRIIGRSSKADITVRDMGISRIHCQVSNDGTRCTVEDLNSKNGTLVNGERIAQSTPLQDQDVLRVGTSAFRVSLEGSAPRSGAAPSPAPASAPREQAPPGKARGPSDSSMDAGSLMGAFDQWLGADGQGPGGRPAERPRGQAQPVAPPPPLPAATSGAQRADLLNLDFDQEDPLVGKTIAGCRIEECLRRDAFSTVYRATQVAMDRPAELRLLGGQMTRDASAVRRFVMAAQTCGRLTHPHIVQVYDAGQAEGAYYIALERVEGKTVHDLVREAGPSAPLPVGMAVEVGVQIAGALAHAHAQGLVHGAISLDNILITRHGVAKLAELGFAQWLHDSGMEAHRPETTQFTAPEQLQFPPEVEPRSDLYALGAVLFVMLTSYLPFNAPTQEELEQKILAGAHAAVQTLRPSLPAELVALIQRAMAIDPAERPHDAVEFQRDLSDVRDRLR